MWLEASTVEVTETCGSNELVYPQVAQCTVDFVSNRCVYLNNLWSNESDGVKQSVSDGVLYDHNARKGVTEFTDNRPSIFR